MDEAKPNLNVQSVMKREYRNGYKAGLQVGKDLAELVAEIVGDDIGLPLFRPGPPTHKALPLYHWNEVVSKASELLAALKAKGGR